MDFPKERLDYAIGELREYKRAKDVYKRQLLAVSLIAEEAAASDAIIINISIPYKPEPGGGVRP